MAGTSHDRLRVFLCEPYFTGSHRSWAESLARHSRHDVTLITHAGGFWKWRMQGAALTLAAAVREAVDAYGRPDVLLVSDMVHVPALLGLARHDLTGVPVVLYLHENQLTYPMPDTAAPDHTYAMTNWLSMATADRVVFNSEYHRRDLLGALPAFLRQFPDHRHGHHLAAVAERTTVLPVGVDIDRFTRPRRNNERPIVLWNHRWEYDKDPAAFFDALDAVAAAGIDFDVAVAGERYQTEPPEFAAARSRLGDRVLHWGTAPDEEYPDLLAAADVVVSTARHEFFGVAVVEAVAAGALPLLPNRLSYPELVPAADPYLYDDRTDLVQRLCRALTRHDERSAAAEAARRHVQRFAWPTVAPAYDDLLADSCQPGTSRGSSP